MMTADPRLVSNAKIIHKISYQEAMELSHFGAKVLYPPTIQPVLKDSIPIFIKNTFEPEAYGTLISNSPESSSNPIKGITHIDNIALLTLEGSGMIGVAGSSKRLFEVLSNENINVIFITQASSEHSICVGILSSDADKAKIAIDQAFEMEIAQKYLSKNKFIQDYFALKKSKKSLSELTEILKSDAYYPIKQYIVYQTRNVPFDERKVILETALATNDILVRRAVAESTPVIPEAFIKQYETLLNDNSYQTKEIVLSNLWKNFPDKRLRYLEETKEIIGNNDKSFRLTWLALAMNTENLPEQVKATSYNQLLDFASENYESSVRQNALELLLQLNSNDEKVIELLFKATVHHKWQFTKFGRDNVRSLLKKQEYRTIVEKLASTSDNSMKELYLKFLNEKF